MPVPRGSPPQRLTPNIHCQVLAVQVEEVEGDEARGNLASCPAGHAPGVKHPAG
jgi:hypothetical protein